MSIPSNITAELTNLQSQVQAATPLANASIATIHAMQLNAAQLINDIQTDLTAASMLDTWTATTLPLQMVSGFNQVVTAATDSNNLSQMRGLIGRVASNLDQL